MMLASNLSVTWRLAITGKQYSKEQLRNTTNENIKIHLELHVGEKSNKTINNTS